MNPRVHTEGGRHGAVADTIHGGVHNYYRLPPENAPFEERLETALKFLDSGQATTARRLLDRLIVEAPNSGEVCFYWLLAFFGGRTYWELSAEERDRVTAEIRRIGELPTNSWSTGIDVIRRLVYAGRARPDEPVSDSGIEADLNGLPPIVGAEIRQHLERLIQGSLKDELWQGDIQQAKAGRTAGDRRQRVWKFFEPDPLPPRVCPVSEVAVSRMAKALLGIVAVSVIGASGTLGSLVIQRGDSPSVIVLAGALLMAVLAWRSGVNWRFRAEAQGTLDQERRTIRSREGSPRPGGFADEVNQLYLEYLQRFAAGSDRERAAWSSAAYIPLCRLRNDLVDAYRERPATADRVKWLIRFQVKDMRRRWVRGEALDARVRVPVILRLTTIVSAGLTLPALVWVLQSAVRQDALRATGALLALAFAAAIAATVGLRIMVEHEHARAGGARRERLLTGYRAEYRRWQRRLADRPTDMEMAQWLDCDRRLLLDQAIREYRLKWSDIQAYASLEAGGPHSRKARVTNGPWRYSRYRMLVFLLTSDGIRQLTTDLVFEEGAFHRWERTNYRYDAVAAVQVSVGDEDATEFHLFLVSGTDIEVEVTESGRPGADDDPQVLVDGAEDATGLRHTLFVLEGVAAEGRRWWTGPAYQRAAEMRASPLTDDPGVAARVG
ncbi:hypothetical protein Aco03nite_052080 [Actinoplanes couchii]|uniref:Uncharacterized protein n=1 Tax=Actinoplanes couchii TaxID=403638 RepID=A0ABQ3XE90_9ACTN|nr:hypothetical protein Aco03nite_052080 [Actinoplanes couchii]